VLRHRGLSRLSDTKSSLHHDPRVVVDRHAEVDPRNHATAQGLHELEAFHMAKMEPAREDLGP
jgi:hypothetical protein